MKPYILPLISIFIAIGCADSTDNQNPSKKSTYADSSSSSSEYSLLMGPFHDFNAPDDSLDRLDVFWQGLPPSASQKIRQGELPITVYGIFPSSKESEALLRYIGATLKGYAGSRFAGKEPGSLVRIGNCTVAQAHELCADAECPDSLIIRDKLLVFLGKRLPSGLSAGRLDEIDE